MIDRPPNEGAMFWQGMEFSPTEDLKQSELNRLVVHLFRRFFTTPAGDPLPVKEHPSTMLTLVQFLVDLGYRLDDTAFAEIPDDLKRYFMVVQRDGKKYRHGSRPRF